MWKNRLISKVRILKILYKDDKSNRKFLRIKREREIKLITKNELLVKLRKQDLSLWKRYVEISREFPQSLCSFCSFKSDFFAVKKGSLLVMTKIVSDGALIS
ncbi:hypothetical protein DQM68_01770 [Leptospira mayottensis]|uniref:Uncharacterized protein n=2 Tax=Leptospira mayottensis TaxID=1137606 RepID=A0AA87MMU2_9LEPT|nr:hypothetical protein DQM68_01770 [Leptospira mayottensis]AXR63410.1 hypothetical protein DQM28_03400 [Leptospira mayottensis]AZQ01051.1 hypothetical protein LEP1GSC190_02205 [Leptospira mayottensis 200901116]EKS00295.1 hypothetical protein LEP1GSC125_2871 [Leptospira mayottensis 200901122]TGN17468.1 hypothetical protein EHR03_02110 [Leptospira mayottensis]